MDSQPPDEGSTPDVARAAVRALLLRLGYDPDAYDDVSVGWPLDGEPENPRILFVPPNRLPEGHPLRVQAETGMRDFVEAPFDPYKSDNSDDEDGS
jgi:hypothetical protein